MMYVSANEKAVSLNVRFATPWDDHGERRRNNQRPAPRRRLRVVGLCTLNQVDT
jgi:hypothetical protein